MRLFLAGLAVSFVAASAIADRGATTVARYAGLVVSFEPGRFISIADDRCDYGRCHHELDERVIYEDLHGRQTDASAVIPGALVTLWSKRTASDRHRVVERIRITVRDERSER
jgi:hypothetical protein